MSAGAVKGPNAATLHNLLAARPSHDGIVLLTLLGPQSRFGDKLLVIRVFCPHIWECGSKRAHPRVEGGHQG